MFYLRFPPMLKAYAINNAFEHFPPPLRKFHVELTMPKPCYIFQCHLANMVTSTASVSTKLIEFHFAFFTLEIFHIFPNSTVRYAMAICSEHLVSEPAQTAPS